MKENSGRLLAFKSQKSQAYQHTSLSATTSTYQHLIVNAIAQKVTVLEWVEGFYEERVYEGEQAITSPIFPIQLTTAQVLQNC